MNLASDRSLLRAATPTVTKPVLYKLDFKRIAARTAFWAGRPAMRVIQALDWFKDTQNDEAALISGITNYLIRSPHRPEILNDLRQNKHAAPAWMFPLIDAIIKSASSESDYPPDYASGFPGDSDKAGEREANQRDVRGRFGYPADAV